jgi:hypothetical protein
MPISKKDWKPKPPKKKKQDPHFSSVLKKASKEKSVSLKKKDTVTLPFKDASFVSTGTTTTSHMFQPNIKGIDSCIINQDAAKAPFPDKQETVNHPAHYGGDTTYEAIKVIEAWDLGFNLGNTVKYISRAGKKCKLIEDLKKAAWYLNREIENLEKED